MKRINIFKSACVLLVMFFLLASCSTQQFLMTSEGENFDALSKITDGDKIAIHPDGAFENKNLVYALKDQEGYFNIFFKDNVLSKGTIQKTSGNNYNLSPSFCDSNGKILFQYYDKTNFDIYYVDAFQGKAITQITYTDENEYNPSWSQDGKLVIFEKGVPPKTFVKSTIDNDNDFNTIQITKNQIWLKNIETGELKMLGEGSFPVISPDGKEIAFVKYDLNKKKTEETGTLWTMSINGDSPKQITDNRTGYATQPSWSPNGKKLVFNLTKINKEDPDIYTVSTNGENLTQLTKNESNDFSPYWSKDSFIYFSSDRGTEEGNYQIWRFKINN